MRPIRHTVPLLAVLLLAVLLLVGIASTGRAAPPESPAPPTPPADAADAAWPVRPQTPTPPFPYREIAIAYDNPRAPAVHLAGTLTLPKTGNGPFPVALMITGSGAQDRDETIFGHKPFAVLADYLARRGIATLRVDDRGVGGSTGATPFDTSADFASDVRAGVAFLRSRPEIDPEQIGLIGHSEGGMIAPMIAGKERPAENSPKIAFLVLLAGTGVPGDQVLRRQSEAVLRALNLPESAIEKNRWLQQQMFQIVRDQPDFVKRRRQLFALAYAQKFPSVQIPMVASPWMRFLLDFDPATVLRKVRCPVLAINGSKDTQVVADQNLPAIEKALRAGGNPDVTTQTLPGLNHLFQTATTGTIYEYSQISETFAPTALESIGDWLTRRVH